MQQLKPSRESLPTLAPRRFNVFIVEDYNTKAGEDKAQWTRVGVAFENKDAKAFNVQLTALPVSGKLVMRIHQPKPAD